MYGGGNMAKIIIVPGRGRVRVDNSFGCGIVYSSGDSSPRRETPYERTKREVEATGNKWAIENFNATHN